MAIRFRIVSFNLENLDNVPNQVPTLAARIRVMQPQLHRLDADVLCLQEVHGQNVGGDLRLQALETLLADTPYAGFSLISTTQDGQPERLRNLVIMSRFPIVSGQQINQQLVPPPLYSRVTAEPPDEVALPITWERPILHAELELPGGVRLHVINVHLKSKNPAAVPGQQIGDPNASFRPWKTASGRAEGSFISAMKRVGHALELRRLIDSIFDVEPDALIAVCGDFNADAEDVPLQAIRGDIEETENPELIGRVLVLCERTVPEPARFSLIHRGRGEMLDHILSSRSLLAHYRGTEIHNELLHDESAAFAFDEKFPESDHAPVVATFELRSDE
jgi:predicted extracellular nuclease